MVNEFDVDGISKSPAIFDIEKLKHFNAEYIRAMSPEQFAAVAEPYIRESVKGEQFDPAAIAALLQARCEKLTEIPEFQVTTGGDLCKSIQLHKVKLPNEMAPVEERRLRYSDADVNVHVNNVRYADFACDAIGLEREGEGRYVSSLQISYVKECKVGETITLMAAQQDDTWYVCGKDSTGTERFDAAISLKNIH